jgi:hypothetical protein
VADRVRGEGGSLRTEALMSWEVEVVADASGQWAGNGVRFATHEEADAYQRDLRARWAFLLRDARVVERKEPATHRRQGTQLVALSEPR